MSEPFMYQDDFIIVLEGKWYRFPTLDEAYEFYEERK
jgi:hypothetical protein